LISDVRASINWVNANPTEAAEILANEEILPSAAIAAAAIPRTNSFPLVGSAARAAANEFLTVLFDANPESIGGSIPGDGFYFE